MKINVPLQAHEILDIIIVRIDGPLHFANRENFKNKLQKTVPIDLTQKREENGSGVDKVNNEQPKVSYLVDITYVIWSINLITQMTVYELVFEYIFFLLYIYIYIYIFVVFSYMPLIKYFCTIKTY